MPWCETTTLVGKRLVVEKSWLLKKDWLLKKLKKLKKNKLLNKVVAIVGCSISFSVSHYREQRGTHHRGRAGRTRGSRSFSILLRGLFFVAGVVGVVGVVFGAVVVNRLLRSHRWKKKQSVSIDRGIETYTINRSKDTYTTPNVIRACMFIVGSVWEVTQRVQPTSTNQQVTNQQVTNQQVNKPTCYKPTCYKLTGQCGSATGVAQHEFGSFGSFGGFGPGNQSHRKKVSIDHTRHCMYTYK